MKYLKKYQKGRLFEQDEFEEMDDVQGEVETEDVEAPEVFNKFIPQLQEALAKSKECIESCKSSDDEIDAKIAIVGEEAVNLGDVMLWSVTNETPNLAIICDAATTLIRKFAEFAVEGGYQDVATLCIRANQEFERATGDFID